MAEIFVSYASSDREHARQIAELLAARGYTIWWDRTIPPGRVFDEVIQEALNAARCVVVLWSKASVASNWVKAEAGEAAGRGILVPALIDDVVLPIEFKRIQSANLVGWNGKPGDAELNNLLSSVDRLAKGGAIGGQPSTRRSEESPAKPDFASRRDAGGSSTASQMKFVAIAIVIVALGFVVYRFIGKNGKAIESSGTVQPTSETKQDNVAASASTANPSAGQKTPPATVAPGNKFNLLAADNGGHIVAAAKADWVKLIDSKEDTYLWVDDGEGIFAFKDDRPATFDTFAVLIPGSDDSNIKDFELFAGNDSSTGRFDSIGKFTTQNIRMFKSPYQEFTFPPVKAKYLKVKALMSHGGSKGAIRGYEFALFGKLE